MSIELYYLRSFEQEIVKELLPLVFHQNEALHDPLLEPYHAFYGLHRTDIGVYAMIDHKVAGGAWVRLLKGKSIMGSLDDTTPEVVIAVKEHHRNKGVGTQIMRQLIEEASLSFDQLYACVTPKSPTQAFFETFDFIPREETIKEIQGTPKIIMAKKLVRPKKTTSEDAWIQQTRKWREPNSFF